MANISARVCLLRVYACAAGFWLLFSAYLSAQLLQTAVDGGAGYACLYVIYALFSFCALIAPHAIGIVKPRFLIPLSALAYCGMVIATAFPPTAGLVAACAAVGIAAAFLWSAQGLYISQCANQMIAIDPQLRLSNANIITNSAFYTVFASSGAVSYLLSSLVMVLSSDIESATRSLFAALSVVAGCGVALLACLPDPDDTSSSVLVAPPFMAACFCSRTASVVSTAMSSSNVGTEAAQSDPTPEEPSGPVVAVPSPPSIAYMLAFLTYKERRMRFVAPIIFAFGAMMGKHRAKLVM